LRKIYKSQPIADLQPDFICYSNLNQISWSCVATNNNLSECPAAAAGCCGAACHTARISLLAKKTITEIVEISDRRLIYAMERVLTRPKTGLNYEELW
jgi:hypothetical protein